MGHNAWAFVLVFYIGNPIEYKFVSIGFEVLTVNLYFILLGYNGILQAVSRVS
jgi:hypothetical protein